METLRVCRSHQDYTQYFFRSVTDRYCGCQATEAVGHNPDRLARLLDLAADIASPYRQHGLAPVYATYTAGVWQPGFKPGLPVSFTAAVITRHNQNLVVSVFSVHPDELRSNTGQKSAAAVETIKYTTIAEMCGLGLLPATKHLIDSHQLHFRETGDIFRSSMLRFARAVVVFSSDGLTHRRVQVLNIGFGQRRIAIAFRVTIHHANRRFSQNRNRRHNNFKVVAAQFVQGQKGLVFPGQQHITDTTLNKGCG